MKKNSSKSKKTETTKRKTLKYRQQQQKKMKFHWKKIKNSVFFCLKKIQIFFLTVGNFIC